MAGGFPSIKAVKDAYVKRNGIGRKIALLESFPSAVDRERLYMLASQWQDANTAFESALLDLLIELGAAAADTCLPMVEDKRLALAIKNLVGTLSMLTVTKKVARKNLLATLQATSFTFSKGANDAHG